MQVSLIEKNGVRIVEGPIDDTVIGLDNLNDLLSATYEHDTNRFLMNSDSLPAEFFDLSTKLAGEILQKLTNYKLVAA